MIRTKVFMVMLGVTIVSSTVLAGVAVAQEAGCTSARDIVELTGGEDTSTEVNPDNLSESPFYDDESQRFEITGSNRQWIRFACWALTN